MQAACFHTHSRDMNLTIYGQKLEVGDVIEQGDLYECSNGLWRRCGAQLIGEKLDGEVLVTILRPVHQPVTSH